MLQFPLFNAQQADGSGHSREIAPGKSLTFPAALPPLSVGAYSIRVEGEAEGRSEDDLLKIVQWPATRTERDLALHVRADPALAAQRDELMIKRVRANDHFAQYLSSKYPRQAVREALAKDLNGADAVAADRAADGLWTATEDAGDGAIIAAAIVHHLDPANGEADTGLMNKLLNAAGRFNSTAVRNAVTRLAAARPAGGIRETAVQMLDFPAGIPLVRGDDGSMEVGSFRSDGDARTNLSRDAPREEVRRDPAVLDALLKIAKSADPHERKLAFEELGVFLDSPRAVAALRIGIGDHDQAAQNAAVYALTRLEQPSTTQPSSHVQPPPREADQ